MNNQVKHELKILPEYFQDVWNRTKTFEVRKNDRSYAVGDELFLREWAPDTGYTGSGLVRRVSYMLDDSEYVKEGFVILGLADPVPTIKPGDKVRHKRFKTLPTGIVRSISESGKRALVKWDDYNSAYYELINLEVVE
ncbi:DUF3850 domain-containing protein [Paenibacillus lautus]|uniref:DUF3850 domain-containing protein n=1 Tax=Paenibacillus lautus TaxID=1401 RepID=A0A385TXM7_PAELA|nr:DUF3850 domain-containing protein [Paenibacillus lautus]AYB47147.1 DUF3850 domain-containing protein [Paenibacillus lautus]